MENNRVLARLKIMSELTTAYKIFAVIWWIALALVTYFTGSAQNFYSSTDKGTLISKYTIFHMRYYHFIDHYPLDEPSEHFYTSAFLLGIVIIAAIAAVPLVIRWYHKFIADRCTLNLVDKQIVGKIRLPLSTKMIQLPIEKLDNVFESKGIWDYFQSGSTVVISSNSGRVRLHYVQNAHEFVSIAMEQIEKVKKDYGKQSAEAAQTAQQGSGTLSGKIAELQKLRDQGILTDEQFESKKQELISNFN